MGETPSTSQGEGLGTQRLSGTELLKLFSPQNSLLEDRP